MNDKELINSLKRIVVNETMDERESIKESIDYVFKLNDNAYLLSELNSIIEYHKSLEY